MSRTAESLTPETRLTDLNREEMSRYSRHLLLPEVGLEGQKRLKASRVLIVGTGGLGAPLALYLAAAGVGTIGLVDFDTVEISNLQRQIIHSQRDVDRPKVASAQDRLKSLNPQLKVVTHNLRLTGDNALGIIKEYDVVADGTDNFPTRYLLNDACVFLGLPLVYGSIYQFEGQASVFQAGRGPCYRCLFPTPPSPGLAPSCGEAGVMGVLPGIIGCIQAAETIKLILGGAETLAGRLLLFDAWLMKFTELSIERDPACPVCGEQPTITELIDYEHFCGLDREETGPPVESLTALELKARLDRGDQLQIIDIREPHERAIFKFPGGLAMPFGQVIRRKEEFDPSIDAVFICKVGQRSLFAIRSLREAGYQGRLFNLKDGLNSWARDVDPSLPQY